MRFTSLLVGVGDNPPLTPPRRGILETGDNPPLTPPPPRRGGMGMSEEVGARIVNLGFFYHSQPKILAFCSSQAPKSWHFFEPQKG
ncbi:MULTISPECIES: hypothetical protein [unclassified Okeania]|uniref:hypothetical protein n=1 Tax=unclassified Okeania TaxID=2634635 RepID=UPI0013B8DE6C|nr:MULTISPECIES: hypothetical protein [unclassified Okeania]NES77750.1 hypothetical protein [Okeania sp. SIO1H4]NET19474.1 hypothetical protein [Okeania sp. SIO1H5]NET94196.1 hypothetical protein [Okeania sp. SIO1H2]